METWQSESFLKASIQSWKTLEYGSRFTYSHQEYSGGCACFLQMRQTHLSVKVEKDLRLNEACDNSVIC